MKDMHEAKATPGTDGGIRTHADRVLNPVPLPLGYTGTCAGLVHRVRFVLLTMDEGGAPLQPQSRALGTGGSEELRGGGGRI